MSKVVLMPLLRATYRIPMAVTDSLVRKKKNQVKFVALERKGSSGILGKQKNI